MYSYVQDTSGRGASPKSLTFGSNNTAGNLIVVGIAAEGGGTTVSSITDTQGNTYTQAGTALYSASNDIEVWFAVAKSSAANTVTVTQTSGTIDVNIAEYSGVNTLDTSGGFTGGVSAVVPSVTLTTATNNELLYGFQGAAAVNYTAGSGFTGRSNSGNGFGIYYLAEDSNGNTNTAGSNTVTYTGSTESYGGMVGVAFKQVSGAASIPNKVVAVRQAVNRSNTY